MTKPVPSKTPRASRAHRAAAQTRQREVERHLAELGLAGGPRGLAGEAAPPLFDGGFGRRLRLALETLGPVFAAFGRYLGSRPDLLPLADCLELRRTEERVEPLPPAAVHALVEAGSGQPWGEVFERIDDVPLHCGLVGQTHRARLQGGWGAMIRLVRPDLGERLESDLSHLPLLAAAFEQGGRPLPVERVVADFRQALAARADLQAEAAALRAMRMEGVRLVSLRLPRTVLAAPRLLCLELLEGVGLEAAEPPLSPPAGGADLARRLCLAWLYHALRGKAFPVELAPGGLLVFPEGSIGLQEGTFEALPPASRQRLQSYLAAAAAEDPDEACAHLLAEMEPAPAGAEAELRQRFRQAVAFRDGGWGSARDGQSLAEQLFLQWRLAGELGFRPAPPLEGFYRGLFELAVITRSLAPPDRDTLREALESLRLLSTVDQLGRMADLDRLRRGFEGYMAALADLPVAMDGALSRVAEGRPRLRVEVDEESVGGERRQGTGASLTALALALAAVALVTVRLGEAPGAGPWIQAAGATLFTILGGLLLRALGRQP